MARESKRSRRERIVEIARRLGEDYPDAECALLHDGSFQLLAATVLSAQCTDKMVNKVTPALFDLWPTAEAMAAAPPAELEEVIHRTGFFRQKAKSLLGLSRMLVDDFGAEVPHTMEELIRLPGVARKTANVVLGVAFGIAVGVVVDTHVRRIVHKRLRLSPKDDPVRIERDVMELLPPSEWIDFGDRLIWHGRQVCDARKPRCADCSFADLCPSAFPG
jgi:endonuclease-3